MDLRCDVRLPASKSESNRALMIAAYGGFAPDFQNLSDSKDTLVLKNALDGINARMMDVENCGTAARFMTTFLACHDGNWLLTGSERMLQRPMAPLVEALTQLGAEIQYVGEQGFLPLHIQGKTICGGKACVEMSQSSQFASSLLMAAPMWRQGLELELFGELNSMPYLDMTLAMMRHFGAEVEGKGRTVVVTPKPYQTKGFTVSSDWSAASYWYEMAALSSSCEIGLHGLAFPSLQGDSVVRDWMASLGVETEKVGNTLVLRKAAFERQPFAFDFSSTPDLFPTMVATCAGLQVEARFSGIGNLGIKESDRVEAMKSELSKIGVKLDRVGEDEAFLSPNPQLPCFSKSSPLYFSAHNDHRIVMALAPLSMKLGSLSFDHPEVVRKSYPAYWNDTSFLAVL